MSRKRWILAGALVLGLPLAILALPRRLRMDGAFAFRCGSYGDPSHPFLKWSLDEVPILGHIRLVSARVERHEPGLLRGIAFQVARDRDGDDLLEPEEWETLASAKAEPTGEGDVAQTRTVFLLLPYDGWAILFDDENGARRQQLWICHGKNEAEWSEVAEVLPAPLQRR
ncbi:MAG: hypothetical protein L0323_00800 [Planctomycetes bacterium]|nr:hypothetical protein [Planctomycetota bacterium]